MLGKQSITKNVSFTKNVIQGAIIWFLGWLILAGVEIAFRVFNWVPLAVSVPLLILALYTVVGIVAGGVLGFLSSLVLKSLGKRVQHITLMRFFMASCVTTIIFFYGGIIAYEKILLHASDTLRMAGIIGFLICSPVVLILVYYVLRRCATGVSLFASFCALSLSSTVLLVGIVFVNEILLPGRLFIFPVRDIVINIGFLFSCITLYYLLSRSFNFLSSWWKGVSNRFFFRTGVIGMLALVLILGVIWYVFSSLPLRKPADVLHDKPNVILITMDTTRADHLSCYGYHRKTTPYLDQFAQESVLFTNAYAPSSWTLPSHASIFTGMYPAKHGSRVNADFTRYLLDRYGNALKGSTGIDTQGFAEQSVMYLGEENITLAELLSAEGYATAGIISGPWCLKKFGLAQGFEFYDETLYNPDYDATYFALFKIIGIFTSPLDLVTRYGIVNWGKTAFQVNEVAISWLKRNYTRPFLLFLNYYDPHHHYSPPVPFDRIFFDGDTTIIEGFKNPEGTLGMIKGQRRLIHAVMSQEHTLSPAEKDLLVSLYDGEIRYLDHYLNNLFETLKKLNIYDNSMIIVTSDHGELFGNHGIMTHGFSLYEEELKIPLIIKYPSSKPLTGVMADSASLVDVLPTVVSTLGLSLPEGVQGKTLPAKNRPIIAESYNNWRKILLYGNRFNRDLRVIFEGSFKYIWGSNGCELYDIEEDPREDNNLIEEMPGRARSMQAMLDEWLNSFSPVISRKFTAIDKATEESLRALGYLP